jgi:transketolase
LTHHSIHDFALLRAINNITIVAPADNVETRNAVRMAAQARHPVYLRFGKRPLADLHKSDVKFEFGKAIEISSGSDVTLIATGETVHCAVAAADVLAKAKISAGVLSMHTVKPLDVDSVLKAADASRAIVTVEEHSACGGLGEACAAALLQAGKKVAFRIVAIPDEYTVTGSQLEIFKHYGISADGLTATARGLLAGERRK